MTLSNRNNIDHLILLKDTADLDRLFKQAAREINFFVDGTTIDLDLHEMCLLLLKRSLADLGMGEDADDSAVLLDTLELEGDSFALASVLLSVFGERLLLRFVPILIEAALDLVAKMLSPDGGQRTETAGGFDVSNNTDSNHLVDISTSLFYDVLK